MREREAFQELDYPRRVRHHRQAGHRDRRSRPHRRAVSRAFYDGHQRPARAGRDRLPEDMLTERDRGRARRPFEPVETWPGLTDMSRAAEDDLGRRAPDRAARRQPLVGGRVCVGRTLRRAFCTSGRDDVPPRAPVRSGSHPCYAGDLGIGPDPNCSRLFEGADLVILVGGRLGEMPSQGYTLLDIPAPKQTFVHVFPDVAELGRVYRAELAINAAPTAFAAALEGLQPPNGPALGRRHAGRACRLPSPGPTSRGESAGRGPTWARSLRRCAPSFPGDAVIHQRRRQFLRLGAPLFALPHLRQASLRRSRARWATACRPRSA